jgi:hypothetical protein
MVYRWNAFKGLVIVSGKSRKKYEKGFFGGLRDKTGIQSEYCTYYRLKSPINKDLTDPATPPVPPDIYPLPVLRILPIP